jgi:hypothetical protein
MKHSSAALGKSSLSTKIRACFTLFHLKKEHFSKGMLQASHKIDKNIRKKTKPKAA